MFKKLLKNEDGFTYVEITISMLILIMILVFIIDFLPVYVVKNNLDYFAREIMRTAEINGEVGEKVNIRIDELKTTTKLSPGISWNRHGKININEDIEVELTYVYNVKTFLGDFPIELNTKKTGKSEVYQK